MLHELAVFNLHVESATLAGVAAISRQQIKYIVHHLNADAAQSRVPYGKGSVAEHWLPDPVHMFKLYGCDAEWITGFAIFCEGNGLLSPDRSIRIGGQGVMGFPQCNCLFLDISGYQGPVE